MVFESKLGISVQATVIARKEASAIFTVTKCNYSQIDWMLIIVTTLKLCSYVLVIFPRSKD